MSTSIPTGAFLLDENLAPQLAQALALLDGTACVKHITSFFAEGTPDATFLPALGASGAFLISRDTRQRHRPAEIQAYRRHRVGAFILGGKNLQRWDIVKQLVVSWPAIKNAAATASPPFAYRVRPNGGRLEPLPL